MKRCLVVLPLLAAAAMAQGPPQAMVVRPGPDGMPLQWWKQPYVIDRLNLTPEQRKKIDDVFQQSRVKLIDMTAAVDREEAIMEQLMAVDPPDAAKVRPQIDRIAQARAELEKVNANMLLGMRLLLTKDQWDNLRDATRPGRGPVPRKVR